MNPERIAREPIHPTQYILGELEGLSIVPVSQYFNRLHRTYQNDPSYAAVGYLSDRLTDLGPDIPRERGLQGAFDRGGLLGIHAAQLELGAHAAPLYLTIDHQIREFENVAESENIAESKLDFDEPDVSLYYNLLQAGLHDYDKQSKDYHDLVSSLSPSLRKLYGEDGLWFFKAAFGFITGAKEHYLTNESFASLYTPPSSATIEKYITNQNVSRVQREN